MMEGRTVCCSDQSGLQVSPEVVFSACERWEEVFISEETLLLLLLSNPLWLL